MRKINIIKKTMLTLCVLTVTFMSLPIGNFVSAASNVYLAISSSSNLNPTEGDTITFTLKYTGDVANISVNAGAITLNGFTATKTITGTGYNRTLTLSNIRGAGANKSVYVASGTAIDSLSNTANSVTSKTFTINAGDITPPVLSVSNPSAYSIYAGQTVTYTATYTDNIAVTNVWLDPNSIALNGFTATKTITGSGNVRTITLSNIQGTLGSKNITITGGTGIDAEGNLCNSYKSATFNLVQKQAAVVDTIAPVLKLSGPNPNSIYAGQTVTYIATYTDNVAVTNVWLDPDSIGLNGFTATKTITGSGNTRTITLSNIQGTAGNKSITITGGTGIDAEGNLCNSITSTVFSMYLKTITDPTTPITPTVKSADWIENPNTGK